MPARDLAPKQPSGSSRRGRPSASRAVEIDRAIRAAALETFLSAGFDAASMDAIAAAAQVSKGTLYARYQSKEALFRTVLECEVEKLSDIAGAEDHLLPPDLTVRLRHYARSFIKVMQRAEYQRLEQLIATARLTFPDITGLWYEIGTKRFLDFLAAEMTGCSQVPDGQKVDWNLLANLFLHSIASWHRAESSIRTVSEAEATAYSDAVISIIVRSLPVAADRTLTEE